MPSPMLQRKPSRAAKPAPASSRPVVVRQDSLDELIATIARLQKKIVEELHERRAWLRRELSSVDAELADLTGETTAPTPPASMHRVVTVSELIGELQAAPGHALNIREANLEVKNVRDFAKAHPRLLKVTGKGAALAVTLLERKEEKPRRAKAKESHPDLFTFGDSADESK